MILCKCVCRFVCTVCLNWKAVIKCVDLSTISSSSQCQWRTNRSTAMSHQAPRITTPPSISLSLPPSTSTQLSITLFASHYTFLCPTLSKLPTIVHTMRAAAASLCTLWDSCTISTTIRHAPAYLSTSGHRSFNHTPTTSLFTRSVFTPLYLPCYPHHAHPVNRQVIEFATVAGSRGTEGRHHEEKGERRS